jgi:prevent-host-death family protein
MTMKTVTAVEAKNSFGRLLEATHREPVMVTKNNREIAAMFSMQDVQALADAFLADPLKAEVAEGKRSVLDALMAQLEINRRLEAGRKAIAEGNGLVADDTYFASLRDRALSRIS